MNEKPKLKSKPIPPQNNQSSGKKSGSYKNGGGKKPPKNNKGKSSGGNPNQPPSPWLNLDHEPQPDRSASFVEYLRWMRSADHQYKDATKTQILQMATEKTNYDQRLRTLNQRTELIAGRTNTFEVTCPWRIRVGGHRGPESILLPAFDALGIPFIPSSTLRGVARTQAIRQVMTNKNCDWQTAEKDGQIVQHFGALDADKKDQAGKIVFLDAYPIAGKFNLEMDMANNIWSWKDSLPDYPPNPNPFLSLKETSFLIGLKLIAGKSDQQLLKQVQDWLIAGLANGAGSQVNTGYGQLLCQKSPEPEREFLKVKFALEGQLIHGYQKPGQWQWNNHRNEWQSRGKNQAEVRSTAFKSMLRYWFRVFALGQMSSKDVQNLESIIFGGIEPQNLGLVKIQTKELEPEYENEQEGILKISYSVAIQPHQTENLRDLITNLTWLMFYLGGVGQGARRAKYDRSNQPSTRGSTLYISQSLPKQFFSIPSKPEEFAGRLQEKLSSFQEKLSLLSHEFNLGSQPRNRDCSSFIWHEALDSNCRIVVVPAKQSTKPYALHLLHQQFHGLEDEMNDYKNNNRRRESKEKYSEMKNLCGGTDKDTFVINNQEKERGAIPSPVWVRDLEAYQVVTIFGATASPRRDYLQALQNAGAIQVFPFQ